MGMPVIAATLLSWVVMGRSGVLEPVLWSLYCELIYYALYPAFAAVANLLGWLGLLCVAVVASFTVMIFVRNPSGFLWGYGLAYTWIYGLPFWISGAFVASRFGVRKQSLSRWQIFIIRSLVWLASGAATALQFHSPVKYTASMIVFAPLAYWWFQWEISNASTFGVFRVLEQLGRGSYSLYLTHPLALAFVDSQVHGATAQFTIGLIACAGLAVAFFFVVEKPSHQLAKRLARQLNCITHGIGTTQ